jgi:hypothetical protein
VWTIDTSDELDRVVHDGERIVCARYDPDLAMLCEVARRFERKERWEARTAAACAFCARHRDALLLAGIALAWIWIARGA